MTKKKAHRGRLQAQSGGLEASETWEQGEPLSKNAGLSLLQKLKEKLSPREQQIRACLNLAFEATAVKYYSEQGAKKEPSHS